MPRLRNHHAAVKSPDGPAQIRSTPEPPHPHPPSPTVLQIHGDRSRRINVVLRRFMRWRESMSGLTATVDVPREEGRSGTAGLEASVGALNTPRRGPPEVGGSPCELAPGLNHCIYDAHGEAPHRANAKTSNGKKVLYSSLGVRQCGLYASCNVTNLLWLFEQIVADTPRVTSLPLEKLCARQVEDLPPVPPSERALLPVRRLQPLPYLLFVGQHCK